MMEAFGNLLEGMSDLAYKGGCKDTIRQVLNIIDEVKSDANKGYMFDMVDEIKNRVLALKGGEHE